MGDRDGSDERTGEDPDESPSSGSGDEQPVPDATAADATDDETVADTPTEGDGPGANDDDSPDAHEDDGSADEQDDGDGETDPRTGRGRRRRSPDEPTASSKAGDSANKAGDDTGADEASDDTGEADEDGDDFGAVDTDDSNWTPPTADDMFSESREPGEVRDDDPDEWWKDHRSEDVADEPSADADSEASDDDEDDDETDLDPAARRDQMQKGGSTEQGTDRSSESDDEPSQARSKGPTASAQAQSKPGVPKGGGRATARPDHTDDPDAEPSTAPDDEEMPLTEHVEEMALRLLAVALVMFGVAGIVVFYAGDLVNFLWYSFLGDAAACPSPQCEEAPRVLHPLAVPLAYLKASTLVGFIIALPVGVYQTYRFMRPGLYPRERRYYLASIPMSLVLAGVGVGFAYFAVLPSMFAYFTNYSEQAAEIAFSLTETFNLMILMLGFFALIFQIPLLVMLAIMMGVTTRQWLADRRLYFWAGFAGVAFLFSPDPTGMAPLIVAVTMIALFEGTLTLLRWTGTGSPIPTAEEAAANRPIAYLAAAVGAYIASAGPLPPGYYDALPGQVTDLLASSGGPIATPAIIAGALIALFEGGAYLLRRYGRSKLALRAWLAADSARVPIWFGAVVVGYFGSPSPTLLTAARDLALAPTRAALVGVGLIGLYELFILGLRYREGDEEAVEEPTTEEV